jgi:aryl-alcohol dehydrogenase-like predicted oxidoreductase
VQNAYSLLNRSQEDLLELCAEQDVAWVPYFPLGSSFPGFAKVANDPVVRDVAAEVGATPSQVGLAWLLAHAPHTLLIAGTRSIAHLEENLGAADVELNEDALARLDAVYDRATDPLADGDGVEAFLDER